MPLGVGSLRGAFRVMLNFGRNQNQRFSKIASVSESSQIRVNSYSHCPCGGPWYRPLDKWIRRCCAKVTLPLMPSRGGCRTRESPDPETFERLNQDFGSSLLIEKYGGSSIQTLITRFYPTPVRNSVQVSTVVPVDCFRAIFSLRT